MIWFTADTHFGHTNIIDYCHRPFKTATLMDEALIAAWNKVVSPFDMVYHLGDFGYPFSSSLFDAVVRRLHGSSIYLLSGNHDAVKSPLNPRFHLLQRDIHKLSYMNPKRKIYTFILCHYPLLSWQKKGSGSIHLHGHCHGGISSYPRRYDVGVDARHPRHPRFAPISIITLTKWADRDNRISPPYGSTKGVDDE